MTTPDPTETFRAEAAELLDELEQSLLDLEEQPDDAQLIDTAFRALHTIKGSGAMFGFDAVAAFTHHVETAFDRLRKGEVPPTRDLIALALAAKDHMRRLIEQPDAADAETGAMLLGRLQAMAQQAAKADGRPEGRTVQENASEEAAGPTTWRIRFRLPPDTMIMGTNPLRLLDELRALGDCSVVALTDAVPSLERMDPEACYLAWDVVLTTDRPRSAIDEVFLFVLDDMELTVEQVDDRAGGDRLGDILVARGDVGRERVEEALGAQKKAGTVLVEEQAVTEGKVRAALAEQKHVRQVSESPRTGKSPGSTRVPAERLDALMDRVGELVIAQARLKQIAAGGGDSHLRTLAEEIERLAAELRDITMGIRMVPIRSLFGRFRRLVHDLASELGKDIELSTEGEETEIDNTVIEHLNDPLVHLIRNSIDHGIEDPESRLAAGKSRRGKVRLIARHAGAEVHVGVRDDGRGLDRQRIRQRAEQQGLLAPGEDVSDAELFQCIFHPGFSTAGTVTNVSGRGVGMDVVKRTIETLRGSIDVSSRPGQGTEITLRLPLTLAIVDGLLVRVGDGRYVIPLSAVNECVELSADVDQRSTGSNFLNIRGDLVPFLRLRELFQVAVPPSPYPMVVIVAAGEARVGLVVDQIIGDHQTVIKSLSRLHADVGTFSGATILGDGTVALILDVVHLVEFGQQREEHRAAS